MTKDIKQIQEENRKAILTSISIDSIKFGDGSLGICLKDEGGDLLYSSLGQLVDEPLTLDKVLLGSNQTNPRRTKRRDTKRNQQTIRRIKCN